MGQLRASRYIIAKVTLLVSNSHVHFVISYHYASSISSFLGNYDK